VIDARKGAGGAGVGRLVVLSGPSCAGKGPLCAALARFHPDLAAGLKKLVLHNSRPPRPIETDGVDYHFRPRSEVEALRGREGFLVMDVRGDLQAVDLGALRRDLVAGDVLFEGNPFTAVELIETAAAAGAPVLGAFLAPLSREEILYLGDPERGVDLPALVAEVMRRRILRRTARQKGEVSEANLEEVERRCTSAYRELGLAHRFEHVIPNHDGEDSENWADFGHPIGDARRALLAFAALLQGEVPDCAERWEADLVP
jgi:guanylate kinase